jgi:site-specific recombinase XerD
VDTRTPTFPNRLGTRPIDITVAQKLYTMAKLRAGIRKQGGIHALRHAFAPHLLEAGRDLQPVQHLLGHRHLSTTARYFHLAQGRVLATGSPFDLPAPPDA